MVSTVPGVALVPRATPVWLMAGIPPGCEGRANASAFAELRASGGHACAGRGSEGHILHTARLLRHGSARAAVASPFGAGTLRDQLQHLVHQHLAGAFAQAGAADVGVALEALVILL